MFSHGEELNINVMLSALFFRLITEGSNEFRRNFSMLNIFWKCTASKKYKEVQLQYVGLILENYTIVLLMV